MGVDPRQRRVQERKGVVCENNHGRHSAHAVEGKQARLRGVARRIILRGLSGHKRSLYCYSGPSDGWARIFIFGSKTRLVPKFVAHAEMPCFIAGRWPEAE